MGVHGLQMLNFSIQVTHEWIYEHDDKLAWVVTLRGRACEVDARRLLIGGSNGTL